MKYSINLEPDQDTLDGRELVKLVRLWLERQELRRDISAHTAACYADKLAWFIEWWENVGPWCDWELSKDKLTQFGDWLMVAQSQYHKPLTYNTRKDILKRLRQCLKWAKMRDHLLYDIRSWVPAADGESPLRERASLDDLAALMRAGGESGHPIRDQALLAIYIGTGVRRAEAVGIDVRDIRMNADGSGTARIRKAKRVRGRQVRARIIAFDRWTGRYLARLLDGYTDQTGPLFRSRGTRRLGDASAYQVVKDAIARAKLNDIIQGPHDLRRNFTTWFAKTHKGELHGRLLMRQLGHGKFPQTDDYILHDADDLVEVICSPLAGHS